jgi:hypothetical protein
MLREHMPAEGHVVSAGPGALLSGQWVPQCSNQRLDRAATVEQRLLVQDFGSNGRTEMVVPGDRELCPCKLG